LILLWSSPHELSVLIWVYPHQLDIPGTNLLAVVFHGGIGFSLAIE